MLVWAETCYYRNCSVLSLMMLFCLKHVIVISNMVLSFVTIVWAGTCYYMNYTMLSFLTCYFCLKHVIVSSNMVLLVEHMTVDKIACYYRLCHAIASYNMLSWLCWVNNSLLHIYSEPILCVLEVVHHDLGL